MNQPVRWILFHQVKSKIPLLTLKERYTMIIVTHNMSQASRISDKTAFFLDGNLIEFNDTKKVFLSPREKETEDYISGRFG